MRQGLTLVTSLIEAGQVSKKDLLILYYARWQVELDLRSIKTVMQMGASLQKSGNGQKENCRAPARL